MSRRVLNGERTNEGDTYFPGIDNVLEDGILDGSSAAVRVDRHLRLDVLPPEEDGIGHVDANADGIELLQGLRGGGR